MPGSTAKGYPYPLGTDRVMDGDDAIKALAENVDTKLGAAATGSLTITPTAVDTNTQATVTLPVGRFPAAAAPSIQITPGTGISSYGITWWILGTPTNAAFTVTIRRNTTTPTVILWTATWAP